MSVQRKFNTKHHIHFSFCFIKDGEVMFPDSGLMLVQASDEQWFVQQGFGNRFSKFDHVVKSDDDVTTTPTFYQSLDAVARSAFELVISIYPHTSKCHLDDFLFERCLRDNEVDDSVTPSCSVSQGA